jgi:deazaflavin-dependent oxidoreductase (nitroreductase family)
LSDPNVWNKAVIEEFRANEGRVRDLGDMPLLLLHTSGAKSGQPRINPVVYLADGDRFVIAASKRGAPTNPDWYYNLVANPEVSVEVGTKQFQARATVATEPERTELFEKMASLGPRFAEYQRNTRRIIPVIVLTRKS